MELSFTLEIMPVAKATDGTVKGAQDVIRDSAILKSCLGARLTSRQNRQIVIVLYIYIYKIKSRGDTRNPYN